MPEITSRLPLVLFMTTSSQQYLVVAIFQTFYGSRKGYDLLKFCRNWILQVSSAQLHFRSQNLALFLIDSTVNPETFARILFSGKALKDTFAT